MGDFEQTAMNLSIMIVLINLMLFVGGYLPIAQVSGITSVIGQVDLTDTNSANFQNSLIFQDSNHQALTVQNQSFATSVLDFVQKIPVLGPIVTLALIFYDMVLKATFGLSILLNKVGVPMIILLPIVIVNFLVIGLGAYYFLLGILRAFGGSR